MNCLSKSVKIVYKASLEFIDASSNTIQMTAASNLPNPLFTDTENRIRIDNPHQWYQVHPPQSNITMRTLVAIESAIFCSVQKL